MGKRADITDVSTGYQSNTTMNDNFEALNENFDNTLSRDGSTPNQMEADLDLNSNNLLNVDTIDADNLTLNGQPVTDITSSPDWRGTWVTATTYLENDLAREEGSSYICLEDHTSGVFSTDLTAGKWELFAQKGAAGAGTGDMLAANNLSDVADAASSLSNIGGLPLTGGTLTGRVTCAGDELRRE